MRFYIVTPSFNQIDFLKRCVASVRDQEAVCDHQRTGGGEQEPITVHHHIQDGGSTDGTIEFLKGEAARSGRTGNGYSFSYSSERDNGMYDAINRGWMRADDEVDVLAHLNCDEQYLSGGLKRIADFFQQRQKVDVVLADMIVVNHDGTYICHRRSLKPHVLLSKICCVGMTATTFQHASVVRDKGILFDTSWRNIGDGVWYNALHKAGINFGVYNELVSLFVDTGDNLNLTEEAVRERKRYADEYLLGTRVFTWWISKFYSLRRYLKEFYLRPPTEYALFWSDLEKREVRKIKKPTGLWHRKGPYEDLKK